MDRYSKLFNSFVASHSLDTSLSDANTYVVFKRLPKECLPCLERLHRALSRSLATTTVPKQPDRASVAIVMICCKGFSFNHMSYKPLDEKRLHTLWKHVDSCLEELLIEGVISEGTKRLFSQGRSSESFSSLFSPSSSGKSSSILEERERLLDMRFGEVHGFSIGPYSSNTMKPRVFQSYETMIRTTVGYGRFRFKGTYKGRMCDCSKVVVCRTPHSAETFDMCLLHPHSHLQEVLVKVSDSWVCLHGDQVRNPLQYLDRWLTLPRPVMAPMFRLLRRIDPTVQLYGTTPDTQQDIYASRQCIMFGCVESFDTYLIVSLIRPTLNYMRCKRKVSSEEYNDIVPTLKTICKSPNVLAGSFPHLEANLFDVDPIKSMSHAYDADIRGEHSLFLFRPFSSTDNGCTVGTISVGGSCLQITMVKEDDDGLPTVVPIEANIIPIKALTEFDRAKYPNITRVVEQRKVSLKFRNKARAGQGSRITIGCHAVIQYVGSLWNFEEDYGTFCEIISSNVGTEKFVLSISTMRVLVTGVYPSGIPRRKYSKY